MAGDPAGARRSVADKIASIQLTVASGAEHSLAEIARRSGLPSSTAHRLASELTSSGLLERTPVGRYRAGSPLRRIGGTDAEPPDLRERATSVLEDLARETRCRARVGVLRDLEAAYIEKQPGPGPVTTFAPAATVPLHASALGQALLAFAPSTAAEEVIGRGLPAYTPETITSPVEFRRALAVTRRTRIAVTRFALEDQSCGVAMPVFGADGGVVAAIEVTVPGHGRPVHPVLVALAIAARSLSRELATDRAHAAIPTQVVSPRSSGASPATRPTHLRAVANPAEAGVD